MRLSFLYLNTLTLVLLTMIGISSCSNLDETDFYTDNKPMGSSSETYKELALILPDNQVLENPFEYRAVYYGDDFKKNCMQIFCTTISRELPVPEATSFSLFLKVPNLNKLRAGQSLDIYQSELSSMISSYGGDYQTYIPNGASVIVREANDEYIDLYVDYLKFNFSHGLLMKNGDYTIFGDIRFLRSEINPNWD